jgi:hypothetical protein
MGTMIPSSAMVRAAEDVLLKTLNNVLDFGRKGPPSYSVMPNAYDMVEDMLAAALAVMKDPPADPFAPRKVPPPPVKFGDDVTITDAALVFRRLRYGDMMMFAAGVAGQTLDAAALAATIHTWAMEFENEQRRQETNIVYAAAGQAIENILGKQPQENPTLEAGTPFPARP